MKKIFVLLLFLSLSAAYSFSQNITYEFSIKYNKTQAGTTADITVTVTSGNPDFTFYLTTNHPFKSEVLMQSGPARKKTHTFKGIAPGKYFIKVEDKSGEQTGRTVIIEENEQN